MCSPGTSTVSPLPTAGAGVVPSGPKRGSPAGPKPVGWKCSPSVKNERSSGDIRMPQPA